MRLRTPGGRTARSTAPTEGELRRVSNAGLRACAFGRVGLPACPASWKGHTTMKLFILLSASLTLVAQSNNGKLGDLLSERALYEATARLNTDDRLAMFETLARTKPEDAHYRNQMAATF